LPITEAWLREVHANATAAQPTYQVWTAIGWQDQPLPHGEYKRSANNVTLKDGSTHWYAPVLQTPAEMHRLIEELQTEGFRSAHPVLQAAYAHHALTVIHPFADGNGRVSRALASVFTYRAAGVPLVIFSDQEVPYWDALADADGGDYAPFIRFIEDRVLDTMALVSDRLRQAHEPIERRAQTIRNMFRSHGGLTHGELQALGQRFMQLVGSALRDATGALHLDPDVQTAVGGRSVGDCTYGGLPYHLFTSTIMWTVALSTTEPVALTVQGSFVSGLADATDNPFAFIVIDASDPSTPPLRMRVTDLHPAVSKAAETRMQGWANMIVQLLLGKLESGLRMALKAQGFTTD
jgi:hypothetical protein